MGLEPELVAMMNDTLAIELVRKDNAGVPIKDRFGKVMFDPARGEKCYITGMSVIARNREGEEETSTLQAIMADPTLPVTEDDRITLPDGSHPAIIEVRRANDETGSAYYLEIRA